METSNKRRALGMGLEELFQSEPLDYASLEEKIVNTTPKEEIQELKLSELRSNPYQPRKNFDEEALKELSESIKEYGVIQPIIAKKSIKGYEIIAGERRVKASIMAGKETIPAIVREFSDEEMMEIALLENLQREDLNSIEEAEAYKKLLEELNITQDELAKRVGKSRSYITNMLGLLSLPDDIQKDVQEKNISMAHARVLSKLENKEQQENLVKKIKNEKISVHELENMTSNEKYERKNKINKTTKKNNEYQFIENELCEKLGTKVKIKKNKIEISFVNSNDLNRLLEIMNLESDN